MTPEQWAALWKRAAKKYRRQARARARTIDSLVRAERERRAERVVAAEDGEDWLTGQLAEDPCGDHRFDGVADSSVLVCLLDLLKYAPPAHHWGIRQAAWRIRRLHAELAAMREEREAIEGGPSE